MGYKWKIGDYIQFPKWYSTYAISRFPNNSKRAVPQQHAGGVFETGYVVGMRSIIMYDSHYIPGGINEWFGGIRRGARQTMLLVTDSIRNTPDKYVLPNDALIISE